MELDGIEIDDIVKEGGWEDSTNDPPVIQLPVAEDDDSATMYAERAEAAAGGRWTMKKLGAAAGDGDRWTKKKLALGLIVSSVFLVLVIGLGAGLGTKGSRTISSAASSVMTREDCLDEEEEVLNTMTVEKEKTGAYTPTFTPTAYLPTLTDANTATPDQDPYRTQEELEATPDPDSTQEDEFDAFFPFLDDDRMKPGSRPFSDQTPVSSNDGNDNDQGQGRKLRGSRSTEGVSGLAQKKMTQRLLGATMKKKLQCEELLKNYNVDSSSVPCSSSKSGKSVSTSKSKSAKHGCPSNKPSGSPSDSPTDSPSDNPSGSPSENPSSSPTKQPALGPMVQIRFNNKCWQVDSTKIIRLEDCDIVEEDQQFVLTADGNIKVSSLPGHCFDSWSITMAACHENREQYQKFQYYPSTELLKLVENGHCVDHFVDQGKISVWHNCHGGLNQKFYSSA